jgi:hypothetical protein
MKGDRPLRCGDIVEVRSRDEILATLDADGRLDGLPFMPEMLQFAGRSFEIGKRAHKACDTTTDMSIREVPAAVHLQDVRCDGSAHAGCETGCLIFWKEAWLKRPGSPDTPAPEPKVSTEVLQERTRTTVQTESGPAERFVCQATSFRDWSKPLPFWSPRQYFVDVRSGNVRLRALFVGLVFLALNKYQDFSAAHLPSFLRMRKGQRFPVVSGKLDKTPKRALDLQPGDRVRVRSRREIVATLDQRARNRGLQFDAELLAFCDKESTVRKRVSKLIDERTGEMRTLPGECIVLEGFECPGTYHRFCPKGSLPFWREIWLDRVDSGTNSRGGAERS